MSDQTVARRYAQALYEEAERIGSVEKIDEDIELTRESLEGSRDLVRLFESPVISRAKKEDIIVSLFESRVQPLTLRFLRLLVQKHREQIFAAVVRAYRELRDEQQGIVEATARVAQPMDAGEEQKLTQAIEQMTGKRVRLKIVQDASLLGGVVIRVGDTVYDGSVSHQLQTLRDQLERGSHRMN